MPYIKKSRRPEMDEIVEVMADAEVKADGDLNYILYAYCKRYITPSYNNYKNYLGELNEAAEEIRRRLLSLYEDDRKHDNGDVL